MKLNWQPINGVLFQRMIILVIILFFSPDIFGAGSGFTAMIPNDSIRPAQPVPVAARWHFDFHPGIGVTLGFSSNENVKTTNSSWLATLNSTLDYSGQRMDFSSSLFAQYGQAKKTGEDPVKLKDLIILSLTPSIPLIKRPAIRLFLETTAETSLGHGFVQDKPTGFGDPLFFYQTLFLGQKHKLFQKDGKVNFSMTYGLGYSFQRTLNNRFQINNYVSGGNPGFESGMSAIFELKMDYAISGNTSFTLNSKAVALSRDHFFKNADQARRTVLISSGFFFTKIGIEYNYHLVKDHNISSFPMADQSVMLTLRF